MKSDDNNFLDEQQQLLDQTKQILQQQSEQLDLKTLMILEKSRQQALKQTPAAENKYNLNTNGSIALSQYLPGALIVIALLLGLSFYTLNNKPLADDSQLGLYSDLELLGAKEPLEFYENIEFYEWLELDE